MQILHDVEYMQSMQNQQSNDDDLVGPLIKQSLEIYFSLNKLANKPDSCYISPIIFLHCFQKVVTSVDVEELKDYLRQEHINLITAQIFQVLTKGMPSILKLLHATDLSLKN